MSQVKLKEFRIRCIEMEKKYGMDFDAFQTKVNNEEKEVCSEWDDLILWEGYHYAYKEWESKYEELVQCQKVSGLSPNSPTKQSRILI